MKKNAINALFLAVFMLMLTAVAFAAQDDSTLSQHIKEADGTSGQDTNTGSGIKTNHIQNDAVTTAKIADDQVTTSKIVDGAVTDAKITGPISAAKISSTGLNADTVDGLHASDFAPAIHTHDQSDVNGLIDSFAVKANVSHTHSGNDILDGTVTTSKIIDGAVTDAKITGTISTSKLNVGTNPGTVAAGDHNHDSLYQRKYAGVTVIAKSGGDYTDPLSAVNDIATWCGSPSSSNPCLVKIMPGIYNIGSGTLGMQSFVDIEGSGEGVSKITGTGGAVVSVSAYSEIRQLSVINTVSGSAINIDGSASVVFPTLLYI